MVLIGYLQNKQQLEVIEIKNLTVFMYFAEFQTSFDQNAIKTFALCSKNEREIKVQIIKNAKLHRFQMRAHQLCGILNDDPVCACVCACDWMRWQMWVEWKFNWKTGMLSKQIWNAFCSIFALHPIIFHELNWKSQKYFFVIRRKRLFDAALY